ncbi:ArAE-2-N domain-containing protein [Fusarium falciforme]|uniref:ArAE-2-N domain-containing protein n=1 Tax=Fusarium falciforme TaxID=195108 RepID=UPI0023001EC7|nr:ArAE-2-N domain-containing protein [Fusarium falciforme]WAO97085.1 ArAE-2-N domain-containing protein [Fusarium falciforme]
MASPEKQQNGSPSQAPEKQEPATAENDAEELPKPKPTTLKRRMDKVGLNAATLVLMFKGSIPPIIGISMYQSTRISSYFTTMGYLIPVISVLAVAILPRDRFIQNLILDLLAICVGSAMSLLVLWSSVQARIHTSPPTSQATTGAPPPYNSSQSAVCAVWLFANIWFANLVRAKLPSFSLPVIIYSILINNSTTSGPKLATTKAAEAFVKEQLLAMLFGMALATGVSLFIFPISSRMVVIGELRGLICLLRKVVGLQKEYLATLARDGIFDIETRNTEEREASQDKKKLKSKKLEKVKDEGMAKEAKAAKRLTETIHTIRVLTGKVHDNMAFAKRDMAWGKLDAKDLGETFTLIRNVTISIVAINSLVDIFHRVAERRRRNVVEDTLAEIAAEENWEKQVWNDVMKQLHTPFQTLVEAIDQGLEHTGICLEILPKPKVTRKSTSSGSDDVEAHGDAVNPGDQCFGSLVDKKVQEFYSQNGDIPRAWVGDGASDAVPRNQTQLYVTLYIQQLMYAAGEALQDLVAFADEKVEDGTMKHKRLLFPTERRLWKWLTSVFKEQDSSVKQNQDILETNNVNYGDSFNPKKDLEHLPATNIWQHFGNGLRRIPLVLGSKESVFGFRVAAATMTVGILAFLEQTQHFFQDQRLDWAMITIALGMTITSGQSIFGFFCRVGGTCLGMIFSLVIWYIVDQKTSGVIVFLWFFIFIEYYFFKFPRFLTAVMIAIITQIIIIGYELQVRQLGEAVATESGQPYHPTYLLAPYRLAVVASGSLIAFFWTIFPSPLTDRTWLREDLSATIYLLAQYFSVILSTMQSQLEGTAGDIESETSPAYHLLKARRKIFGKVMRLMSSIESHVVWQRWEPNLGGRFPVETYQEIIKRSGRIMSYLTLMSYALTHPPRTHKTEDPDDGQAGSSDAAADAQDNSWWQALTEVLSGVEPTNHTFLSTLTLLSNSMLAGQSLPPFLLLPQPYEMMPRLIRLPKDDRATESDQEDNPSLPHRDFSRGRGNSGLTTIDLRQEAPDHVAEKRTRRDPQPQSKQAGVAFPGDTKSLDAPLELRGYAEFVAMQVCSTLVCDDLEGLVRAVSGLVGVVDFSFRVGMGGRDSRASEMVEKPLAQRRTTRLVAAISKEKAI